MPSTYIRTYLVCAYIRVKIRTLLRIVHYVCVCCFTLYVVSVRYKHGEDAERIRKRVRKKLTKALQSQPQPTSSERHVKRLPQLNANDIKQLATSSRCVVVLLKDGRVARFQMNPTHEPGPHSGTGKTRPNSRTSLQVLSDEQFARQLQSMADREGTASPPYVLDDAPYIPPDASTLYWPRLDAPHPFDINFEDFHEPSAFGRAPEYPLLSHLPPGVEDEFGPRLSNLWSQFGLSGNESSNVEEERLPQYERLDSGVSLDTMDTGDQRDSSTIASSAAPKDIEHPPHTSFAVPSVCDKLPGTSAEPVVVTIQETGAFPLDSPVGEKTDWASSQGRSRAGHHTQSRVGVAGSSGTATSKAYGTLLHTRARTHTHTHTHTLLLW